MRGGRATVAAIARALGRHRSSVLGELRRNRSRRARYEWLHADWLARGRRRSSRWYRRIQGRDWAQVQAHLVKRWSPEQIAGRGACALSAVERTTGYLLLGKLARPDGDGLRRSRDRALFGGSPAGSARARRTTGAR